MKIEIKKVLSILIAIIVVFVTMYSCGKIVNAEVPASQKVVENTGLWSGYAFQRIASGKYYTIQDATGIPNGNLVTPNYFYTEDGVTFHAKAGMKVFTWLLNKLVGVVTDPNNLDSLFTQYCTLIQKTDDTYQKYVQNGLYDSNDNFLGYVINDISGCYYDSTEIEDVTTDSDLPNDIQNFYNYQIGQSNNVVDFFTLYPFSSTYIDNNYNSDDSYKQQKLTIVNSKQNSFWAIYRSIPNNSLNGFEITGNASNTVAYIETPFHIMCTGISNSEWERFTSFYQLKNDDHDMPATEFIVKGYPGNNDTYIPYEYNTPYDENGNAITSVERINVSTNTIETVSWSNIRTYLGWKSSNGFSCWIGQPITFYKNQAAYDALNVNKTYTPSTYYTDSYNQNQTFSGTYTTTVQIVDNSLQYNSDIYDNSSNSYYEYVDNGTVNTENITNNVTNITNNYYSESNNPDNPDNPDDPDNPDSPVLEEILAAILRFFNAIGDIIGTILAGLVNMIAAVLESIATLTGQITNLSDLFSSLLGWLPEPIPQVIGIGISLVIIAGVIKFIRG